MKIIMLTEYFYPFAHGGTEWSVYYLAKSLEKKGNSVFILTPNYGSFQKEKWKGVTILRFPFYFHLRESRDITPFWHNNFLSWIINTFFIFYYAIIYKIDTIHVQSKSFIIPAVLAKFLSRKPVVVTVRDYFSLCPYGLCLRKENNFKKCSFFSFYRSEFSQYTNQYSQNRTIFSTTFHLISSLNARFTAFLLRFSLRFVDRIICISKKQQYIYRRNGFPDTQVIYNTMEFPGVVKSPKGKKVLFVGRITPGKGADIFVDACINLLNKKIDFKSVLIGDGFLKKELQKKVILQRKTITFLSQISHEKVMGFLKSASLVVIPSLWEEPFGRAALEALSFGVPLVISNRGGLPEILAKTGGGIIVEPTVPSLVNGMKKGLQENMRLREKINNSYLFLKIKFNKEPIQKYTAIYSKLKNA